uniref:Wsv327-like protein n=1 Tax=Metapenaeus ensis nimavirus TaxID=2133794 RepID=A0A401IPB9_9VIRU|nr:MAG: wsv327-like protein [Metapenaeus ensis nimavirus]GBG35464.1 wsv327-like protein [Metapenaeus ensis nimavirus]
MPSQNNYVFALVAETKGDEGLRDYVSEGLYVTARALHSRQTNLPRVLSSNILGSTWFGDVAQNFSPRLTTGLGPARMDDYEAATSSGDILTVDEMAARVMDPSWRLTEAATEKMTDGGNLRLFPILNLLNGFEYMMSNIFHSAARLAAATPSDLKTHWGRPTWLVDASMLLKNDNATQTSTADVAMGRARRTVAILTLTLIDILYWKKKTIGEAGLSKQPQYFDELIKLISERGEGFIEGTLGDDMVSSPSSSLSLLVPSVTTTLTSVITSSKGSLPLISGTFYEAILGYNIVSRLTPLISSEYQLLISSMADHVNDSSTSTSLEKYVVDPTLEVPNKSVTEEQKKWIRLERERRNKLSDSQRKIEAAFKNHAYLSAAIDMEPSTHGDVAMKVLHREVEREMVTRNITSPTEALYIMYSSGSRQPLFSNFSVSRVRPADSSARFSMYAMWNTLFLAAGRMLPPILSSAAKIPVVSSVTRCRLFVNFFLKDLHALFSCIRCERGFMIKTLDTFSFLELEKKMPGEGKRQMLGSLRAALDSLCPVTNGASHRQGVSEHSLGKLIRAILSCSLPENGGVQTIAAQGKARIRKLDSELRELYTSDRNAYKAEGIKYVSVSKGFTVLAFYLLYSAAATASGEIRKGAVSSFKPIEQTILALLHRWCNPRFPTANLWRQNLTNDAISAPLLACAGVWALRNAVRARRDVSDITNGIFIPGRPLTLPEALSSSTSMHNLLTNSYLRADNVDSGNLVWEALKEMEAESEVWAALSNAKISTIQRMIEGPEMRKSELIVEPVGRIPTTTTEMAPKLGHPSPGKKRTTSSGNHDLLHSAALTGQLSLSVADLSKMTKQTYSTMNSFPLTPYDV